MVSWCVLTFLIFRTCHTSWMRLDRKFAPWCDRSSWGAPSLQNISSTSSLAMVSALLVWYCEGFSPLGEVAAWTLPHIGFLLQLKVAIAHLHLHDGRDLQLELAVVVVVQLYLCLFLLHNWDMICSVFSHIFAFLATSTPFSEYRTLFSLQNVQRSFHHDFLGVSPNWTQIRKKQHKCGCSIKKSSAYWFRTLFISEG